MSKAIKPVPAGLELEDDDNPDYCDINIVYKGAVIMTVLNADSLGACGDGAHDDDLDAEARATADKLIRAYNSHDDLLAAAEKVLAGLEARIAAAPGNRVPLFDGIGELHDAINKAKGKCLPKPEEPKGEDVCYCPTCCGTAPTS